jgi:transposase
VVGDKMVAVGARGFAALLMWARSVDAERVWALEDCRHVSGALERFLIGRGERVVRVSTRLMAGTRRSSRERGKSDQIDAVSVARAALAVGIDTLPTAAQNIEVRRAVARVQDLARRRGRASARSRRRSGWPGRPWTGFSGRPRNRIGRDGSCGQPSATTA